jgi:hypothetical protein
MGSRATEEPYHAADEGVDGTLGAGVDSVLRNTLDGSGV